MGSPRGSVQVIAHRGASKVERENTVAAFRRARALGADAVELDVRRTRDGVLVVHHDAVVPRASGSAEDAGPMVIALTDAHDLPEHVPTFAEALDACEGMWVNVEIKNDPDDPDFDPTDSIADATIAVLAARREPQRWVISSFRIETIDRCRELAPDIRTAWLVGPSPDTVEELLVDRGHIALHPWVRLLSRATIDACHGAGVQVNTWTCDDPDRMRELIEWGIDGICTNVPDVARAVLAER